MLLANCVTGVTQGYGYGAVIAIACIFSDHVRLFFCYKRHKSYYVNKKLIIVFHVYLSALTWQNVTGEIV